MTTKRFEINNNMSLDNKVETYELSCVVDNDNKTFYFIVDSIANVESFVERLNDLNSENQSLKNRLRDKDKLLSNCLSVEKNLSKKIQELENECKKIC